MSISPTARKTFFVAGAILVLGAVVLFWGHIRAWFLVEPMSESKSAGAVTAVVGDLSLNASLSPDPPREKGNRLQLEIRDDKDRAITDAELTVEYRMPAMGSMQEMRGQAEVSESGDGLYAASFDLPMAGSWTLTAQIESADRKGEITFNMTVGSPGLTVLGQSGTAQTSEQTEPLPVHAFAESSLSALGAAMAATDQVRALLARDEITGLADQAKALGAALEMARQNAATSPAAISDALESAIASARNLATANDLEKARLGFGEVTRHLVLLAEADPRLRDGWHIFSCPMAKGFPKWFQRTRRLENPYMGQEMLECGTGSTWTKPPKAEADHSHPGGDEIAHYTCSMHPSVKQKAPGTCPICAMDLTPVTKEEVETGTIFVDEVRRQRIGVRTEKVLEKDLQLHIRAVGKVKYDETRLSDVNLRMSGWVQKLRVNETGARVRRGQTLFTLYSPELYAAELEYLSAIKSSGESESLSGLARTAKQRLRLLGMTGPQIADLEKRGEAWENVPILAPASGYVVEKNVVLGAQVQAGTRVYRIANLDKVWIDADVYESDLPNVRVEQRVRVTLPYLPGKEFDGKVDYIYPTLQGATRTGRVRVVLSNDKLELKPDMYANVELEVPLGERLAIPASAVIYTGPRRLVFVDLGEGRLRPKPVELGTFADGYYEVLSGLREGDVVVTSGNFLIAAESRIRSAAEYWESEDDAN